ncbi:class I SAM-dependent methyltransferase [Thalassobaculum sp. OXR-137]|uniref:class I SAM-dependent methyltransferase n=1 Tax=Thalassobaculum sp. OXR-137 TaxID=3100173 RepID=UPI002AC96616|nr:class I SAM-dependent methyltransferase [Thalassobaculum sp. OXR-137]WPZ33649.1 class I SAM-dependent methyltransferase [Thalassobaculum sp. OXR-137]
MSFSADWLALRAPYDTAARASALERRLADWLSARSGPEPLSVVDLGAGSGNNMAHLAQHLPAGQSWTLVDADGALLEEAARRHPGVSVRQADLAGDLAALIPEGTGLVTASALIDLVSEAWLARLAAWVQEIRCALLVVLTYDGRILWEPELAGDGEIRDLMNRHQRGDKGFGPALGPEAPVTLSRLLPGVETAMSDWQIAAGEPAMRAALVAGWAGAAAEIAPDRAAAIEAWRDRASSEPRALAVGHADQLWLPD